MYGSRESPQLIKLRLQIKPELIMMIGLPASGKTSYAKELANKYGYIVHSSDSIRQELYGNEYDKANNDKVFRTLHKRIKDDLLGGKSVIYDATNLIKKQRVAFLKEIKNIDCFKSAILMLKPYDECIEDNTNRECGIPNEVIKSMYMRFSPPNKHEGYDKITVLLSKKSDFYNLKTLFEGDCGINNFNQQNPHHSLTLGEHCLKAYSYITELKSDDFNLQMAALLHDIGKVFTQTKSFTIKNHDSIEYRCHYKSHECVSAYDSLIYLYDIIDNTDDLLYVSNLIYYHMKPYLSWQASYKSMCRDRNLIGRKMFADVWTLHLADLYAH